MVRAAGRRPLATVSICRSHGNYHDYKGTFSILQVGIFVGRGRIRTQVEDGGQGQTGVRIIFSLHQGQHQEKIMAQKAAKHSKVAVMVSSPRTWADK